MQVATSIRLAAVVVVSVVSLSACTAQAGAPTPSASSVGLTGVPGLTQEALDVMNQPAYAHGQWAISVRDVDTGEQIVSLNADTLFEPGSVVKTYSIGAAWQQFGPDHTIVTPVKSTGQVVDGTLTGDLILVGKGDLTMGGRTKPDGTVDFTNLDHNDANGVPGATLTTEDPLAGLDELAEQVKASGIDRVSGDVIVDDRLWAPAELDGQPVTPIIINQNVIDLTITPGEAGQKAGTVMTPVVAPWTIDNRVETVAAGTEDTEISVTSPDEKTIVLSGTILEDADPVVKVHAFADPATFARTALIEALGRAGVSVTADPISTNPDAALPAVGVVETLPSVAGLTSLPFKEDATYAMKISYNRGAQTFICLLAVANGSTTCNDGLPIAGKIWSHAGLDTTGAVLIDGSGLPGNRITANNEVQLQTIMAARDDVTEWRSSMPGLGVDGSLARVQADSPAAGRVIGKTGTLATLDRFNGRYFLPTKALGGYIDTEGGRTFAFTIMANSSVFTDENGLFAANDDVGKIAASIQQNY